MCIAFPDRLHDKPDILLCGEKMQWVKKVKYLGNVLSSHMNECDDVKIKKSELIGRVNVMLANLHSVSDEVKMTIFQSQCCSFYGTQAWCLDDSHVIKFHKFYNRCVRRILGLPWATHTRYLPLLSGLDLSVDRIGRMFLKLRSSMLSSPSTRIRHVAGHHSNAETIIGHNLYYVCKQRSQKVPLSTADKCTVKAIMDLRDGSLDYFFSKDQQDGLLEYLCTKYLNSCKSLII